ncbi:MAG: hypothetical protein LCH91_01935 [Bacteroidetes bacterium]|nr:hypothetical protein [Bacteroidota bacterium]
MTSFTSKFRVKPRQIFSTLLSSKTISWWVGVLMLVVAHTALATDVGGRIYCDKSGNNAYNDGEGLTSIPVRVVNSSTGALLGTATTNSLGSYNVASIANGTPVRIEFTYAGVNYTRTGTSPTSSLNAQLTCTVSCNCPNNVLSNPSFEGGVSGWSSSGGNFYSGNGYQVCGNNNAFLEATSTSARFYQNVNITPGSTVSLSIWAGTHRPDLDHRIKLKFYNASNTLLSSTEVQVDKDVDFGPTPVTQQYFLSGTAPANTSYVQVEGTANGDYIKVDLACLQVTCPTVTNPNPSAARTICPGTSVAFSASTTARSPVTIEWVRFDSEVTNPYTATGNGKTVLGSGAINSGSASLSSSNFPAVNGQVKTYYVYACLKGATAACQPWVKYQVDVLKPTVSATGGLLKCVPSTVQITAVGSPTSGVTSAYAWTGPNSFTSASANPSVSAAGTYTVTYSATKSGVTCTATDTAIVTSIVSTPTVSLNSLDLTCTKTSGTLAATVGNLGGGTASYAWTVPSGVTNPGNVASFTVTTAGNYSVTVTNSRNGCTASASKTVTEDKTQPTVSLNTVTLTCVTTSQTLTATVGGLNGGTASYAWTVPSGVTNPGNVASFNVTIPGTYSVTVTNSKNGCTRAATTTVTEDKTPPTVSLNTVVLTCASTSQTLTATVGGLNGGTASYVWTVPAGVTNPGNVANFAVTVAGTYSVVVTNSKNGCTRTASTTVTEDKALPTVSLNTLKLTCASPSQTLTATAGNLGGGTASYAWTVPAGVTNPGNVASFAVTVTGTYSVVVTNSKNGCTRSASTTVTQDKTQPTVSLNTIKLTCVAPSQTLTATVSGLNGGTASYVWTVPAGVTNPGNVASFAVTVAGTYSVVVTNSANGCTRNVSTTVTQDKTVPTVQVNGGELTCSTLNLTLSANASSNVTYAWTGLGVNGQTTKDVTVSASGVYQVTVTHIGSGCTASDTAVVTQDVNRPIVVANGGEITCVKSSVTILAEAAPPGVTYSWTGPSSFTSTNASITVQQVGVYTVTVLNPDNGCTASDTAVVSENKTLPNVDAGQNKLLTCEITSVKLDGSSTTPGVTYSWTGPAGATFAPNASSPTPTVTLPGTYTLTVTGPNGCVATDAVVVDENKTNPTVSVAGGVLTCIKTELTLTAVASSGVTYVWSGHPSVNGLTTSSVVVDTTGSYIVTVKNTINGCTASDTAIVTEDITKPTVDLNTIKLTCASPSQTLSATTTNAGANPTYTWTVPSGVTSPGNVASFAVTKAGSYSVLVTNPVNGCSVNGSTLVTEDTLKPTVALNPLTLTCAAPSQTLTATVTNAGANPTYAWTVPSGVTNPGNVASFAVTNAGAYTVEVTSAANGCKASATTTVATDTASVKVSLNSVTLTCAQPSKALTATATNAGANPTYSWTVPSGATNPGNVASFNVINTGTYSVEVTNNTNGCKATASTSVLADTAKVVVTLNTIKLTCTNLSQTLTATATNAGANPTYSWTVPSGVTNPGNVNNFVVSKTGFYSVEVTNAINGCKGTAITGVTADTTKVTVALNNVTLTCASPTKTLKVTADNEGTTPTYVWSVPSGVTNPGNVDSLVVSQGGVYSVSVTNSANGCSASASTTVVLDTTKVSVTLNPITLTCSAPSQSLTATVVNAGTAPTYIWGVPAGATNPGNNPTATASVAGLYTVQVINTLNGCVGNASEIVLNDTNRVTVALNPLNLTCATPTGTLTATVTNGGTTPTYTWQVPQGVANPGNVSSFVVSVAGTYSVEVTNTINGCKGTGITTVSADTTKPLLEVSERSCALNLGTYSVKVISNGIITTTPPYTVVDNGGGLFTISGIPAGQSVLVTATATNSNCKTTLEIAAPDCNCPTVNPPIGSSQSFCEGDSATKLTVVVGTGETADWYSSETGGTKLADGTLEFKPTAAGTYWVEARKNDGSNCISLRIPLTLTYYPNPTVVVSEQPKCNADRQTYSFTVTSNGTLTTDAGQVTNNQNGTFTVSGVPINKDAVVTATSTDSCKAQLTVKAPDCSCPPPKCIPYTVTIKRK